MSIRMMSGFSLRERTGDSEDAPIKLWSYCRAALPATARVGVAIFPSPAPLSTMTTSCMARPLSTIFGTRSPTTSPSTPARSNSISADSCTHPVWGMAGRAARCWVRPIMPARISTRKISRRIAALSPSASATRYDNLHHFHRNTARSHQDFPTGGCAKFEKSMIRGAAECQKQRT